MLLHQRRATSDRFSSGRLQKPRVERRLTHFGGAGEGAMAASTRKRTGFWWSGGPRPSGPKRTLFFNFRRRFGARNLGAKPAPPIGFYIGRASILRRIPGSKSAPESGARFPNFPASGAGFRAQFRARSPARNLGLRREAAAVWQWRRSFKDQALAFKARLRANVCETSASRS